MGHWTERLFEEQADLFAESFADRFDEADEEVADLLALLDQEHDREPERTLDVACGVGRHVLALAERGRRAEGLDISAEFIDRARDRARERELADRTTFYRRDMRDLDEWADDRAGAYDLVTNCWNSLGYYDRETDLTVLNAVRRLLADDGALVVESGNKDFFLERGDETSVSEDGERYSVSRRTYDVQTGRFHTTIDRFDVTDDGYAYVDTMEWDHRMYAPVVLRELCEDAGFDEVDLYGGFDGTALSREAFRVVVVAR